MRKPQTADTTWTVTTTFSLSSSSSAKAANGSVASNAQKAIRHGTKKEWRRTRIYEINLLKLRLYEAKPCTHEGTKDAGPRWHGKF